MSASIRSNHLQRDAADNRLLIDVTLEDERKGQTVHDVLSFDTPADFHTHNDCVAAAVMTLIGSRYRTVRFNFPISPTCAAILLDYYQLDDVGPVSPNVEPRRRGASLGLMFSGGLDSLAMWMILNHALGPGEFRVVTTAFGGWFAFEEQGYQHVPRDVACRTDFRQKQYDRSGRFTAAVPLLFADYLDLDGVVTGHLMNHPPLSIESLADGRSPKYLREDLPLLAGGLGEVHIGRALWAPSPLWIAAQGDPERFEACWRGSSPPGSEKHFKKGMMLRLLYERAGLRLPEWLATIAPPRRPSRLLDTPPNLMMSLYMIARVGVEPYRVAISDLGRHDFDVIRELRFTFIERYNPNVTGRLPAALRGPVTRAFHSWGIEPYDERDWAEHAYVRTLAELAEAGGTRLGYGTDGRRIEPFRWPVA